MQAVSSPPVCAAAATTESRGLTMIRQDSDDLQLITPQQFKACLDADLSYPIGIHTVYSMIKRKGFPSIKIGGRYFVFKSEAFHWLHAQANKGKH